MSTFLDSITHDSNTASILRAFSKDPFKNLISQSGGPSTLLGFNLNRTFIRPESLKKLQKHVKYVPFGEISGRLTVRTYFTVACICDIRGDSLLLCDLHSAKHILRSESLPPLEKWDVIGIANAEIHKELHVREEKQIVRIGTCTTVDKCTHAGDGNRCCVFVDTINGPTCDHHCRQLFEEAGMNRAVLKQNTRLLVDMSPQSSPEKMGTVIDRTPLPEVSQEYISDYLESHANGRGAKFMKALQQKSGPTIGAGFKPGDVIPL
jgi:hypothetical protein